MTAPACAGTTHPGLPEGWDDPPLGRPAGVSLSLDLHIARRARRLGGRCRFSVRSPVARSVPEITTPFTLTPVNRCPRSRRRGSLGLRRSVGVTSDASAPDHPSVAPGKPCARSGVAVWRFAPTEPAFTSWTEPGFPSPSALRLRSTDSVSQPRLACAVRYVAYLRERETPGQGVLSNPQGYPPNFLFTHKKHCVIHRSCTGLPTA